jgi:hypothetical protein
LTAEGRRRLVILEPSDDLREIRVHDQSALAIVRSGKIAAHCVELSLNLGEGSVVLYIVLGNLNNKLANCANRLLHITLNRRRLGRAKRELRTNGSWGLVVLDVGDDLRKVGVHDQSALATVRRGKLGAKGIKFSLDLLIGGIVGNVGLHNLNNELTDRARRLLDSTLDGSHFGFLRGAKRQLCTKGCRRLVVLNPRNDLREIRIHDQSALAIVRGRKIATNGIKFGLDLGISCVVGNI